MQTRDRSVYVAALVAFCSFLAFGDEQTWMANPADSLWNTTSLNWDEGVAWGGEGVVNSAVFGESTVKDISVEGDVPFAGAAFTADGYSIGGPGVLQLLDLSAGYCNVFVGEGLTATIGVAASNMVDATVQKQGPGTLVLTNAMRTLRLKGAEGLLVLASNEFAVAKLEASDKANSPVLRMDDARIRVLRSNNGVFFGDAGKFARAEIGAGGVTFIEDVTGSITQNLCTQEGLEKDGGIIKRGDQILSLNSASNAFNGGIKVYAGQLRFKDAKALGTGSIEVNGGTFLLESNGRRVDVTNQLVLADGSYVGTTGNAGDELGIHNVGFVSSNTRSRLRVGRNAGYSAARLSLDEPESNPIGGFFLRGALNLTLDGGTIVATPRADTPFFSISSMDATNPPVAKVDQGGFRFDSNGSATELGVMLQLREDQIATNFVESAGAFANPGFESNQTGWKQTQSTSPFGDWSRQNNTSAFVKNGSEQVVDEYTTSHGDWFAVLRQMNAISGSFTVPEDGDWTVSFEIGCRPRTDYAGHLVSLTVTLDAGTDHEQQYVIGPRAEAHPFTRFYSPVYSLTAGPHTIRLATDDGHRSQSYESLLIDDFQLARAEYATTHNPPVVKLGEGLLMMTNLVSDGAVAVSNGTLRLMEANLNGATIDVATGGTLALDVGTVTNAAIHVAAGGKLSLRAGRNLIPWNAADLETVDLKNANNGTAANDYWQISPVQGWTFDTIDGQNATSGVQRNGGTMSSTADSRYTPSGNQTLFLRSNTRVSRTVSVPEAGSYRISFLHAARIYSESYVTPITVFVDDVKVFDIPARTAYYDYTRSAGTIELEAGDHVLTIEAGGGTKSGRLVYLDDIRFERVDDAALVLANTTFDFEPGAILDLDNGIKFVLTEGLYKTGGVSVDGRPVRGTRTAFERLGVVVTGEGGITVGPPQGTVFLIR